MSEFSPEQMAEMLQKMVAMMAAQTIATPTVKPEIGVKPQPLDIESKRIYLRTSDATDLLFRQLADWIKDSGFRIQDRRPKAQVLLHILTHEFAKLSEEARRDVVRQYMD